MNRYNNKGTMIASVEYKMGIPQGSFLVPLLQTRLAVKYVKMLAFLSCFKILKVFFYKLFQCFVGRMKDIILSKKCSCNCNN